MASTYATSYEHTKTTVSQTSYSETHQTTSSGTIDQAYIKGIPGLLKLLEVVSDIIALDYKFKIHNIYTTTTFGQQRLNVL